MQTQVLLDYLFGFPWQAGALAPGAAGYLPAYLVKALLPC
jgi:hypothetical protein